MNNLSITFKETFVSHYIYIYIYIFKSSLWEILYLPENFIYIYICIYISVNLGYVNEDQYS